MEMNLNGVNFVIVSFKENCSSIFDCSTGGNIFKKSPS